MSNNLEHYGKSLQLALAIENMKPFIQEIDLEFASEMATRLMNQASFEDSAAVLNPAYTPRKSELLRAQGRAMCTLVKFILILKECSEMKVELAQTDAARSEIAKMFI